MRTINLSRELYRPCAVLTHLRTGDNQAIGIFDLNAAACQPGSAEGGLGIVGYRIRAQYPLAIPLIINHQKRWVGNFDIFSVIDDASFAITFTAMPNYGTQNPAAKNTGRKQTPGNVTGGSDHQGFKIDQCGFNWMEAYRLYAKCGPGIGKFDVGQCLAGIVLKDQFAMIFATVLNEVTVAADHATVFHINQQVVPDSLIASNIMCSSMNQDHTRFLQGDCQQFAFTGKRRFYRCFAGNDIN
ncbi:hypothetical protein D3C73_244860 [compost metagenome]